jgi:hypothetical protein
MVTAARILRELLALSSLPHGGDNVSCSRPQLHALDIQRRGLRSSRRRISTAPSRSASSSTEAKKLIQRLHAH